MTPVPDFVRCVCHGQPCGERDTFCPACRALPPALGCLVLLAAPVDPEEGGMI